MEHVAFTLAEEYAGEVQPVDADGKPAGDPIAHFQGGVLALPPDGRSYDVAAKLADGDGTIVVATTNSPLVELLRAYPALAETAVPEGWDSDVALEDKSLAELRDQAEGLGLSRSGKKAEIIDRVREHQAELADEPDEPALVTVTPAGDTDDDGEG